METSTSGRSLAALPRRVGGFFVRHVRGFAALTLVVTSLLVLLGEYTAAAGAGATCNNTYPGCAGQFSPVGLSIPQFIEWFHRLVAMGVGYVIVGNAVLLWWAYRGTRASRSAWLATFLLPVQVAFGALTVTVAGLVPGGYAPPTQLVHLTTALAIFVALVATLVWIDAERGRGASATRFRYAAFGGLALPVLQAVFARDLFVTFWPSVQTAYHLFGILGLAVLIALVLWALDAGEASIAAYGAVGAVATLANTYLVAGLFLVTARVEAVTYVLLVVQFCCFALLARAARNASASADRGRATHHRA
ncbi:COX15/CtaA family protein [Halarchaeum nitratireducens]|uniref:Heme A synthase n=1 Tax=Halarchaeum nitratireducens TaxID=489913 RepID=A0A830G8F5_9EURY|nr:COX15/CtaA family protein [Halarchaeum nitratireducens]GGN09113.1 heme A synthase [Halarchaeum nitratireducens]